MSNWEKFKKKEQQSPTGEDEPVGRPIGGNYLCQYCNRSVHEATYYPLDAVLKYMCSEGHVSFIEKFYLAF